MARRTRLPETRPRALLLAGWGLAVLALTACAAERGTIGAVLARTGEGRLLVHEAPAGLAAERQGVEPGDEILLIDGRDVRPMTPDQVHQALAGEVGDPVKLTLIREDRVLRVTLRRTPARRHPLPGGETPARSSD